MDRQKIKQYSTGYRQGVFLCVFHQNLVLQSIIFSREQQQISKRVMSIE